VISYRWSIIAILTNLLSRTVSEILPVIDGIRGFTCTPRYLTPKFDSYHLNFWTVLGSQVGEGLPLLTVKLFSDYLNVCDHNLPTLQMDGQTTDRRHIHRESKNPPEVSDIFFHFFHKRLRIFNRCFTHPLCIPIYGRFQIFIELSPTLTKLCRIKRDYLVYIICSKCPPSAETHAFRRLRKSLIALSVASHYKINTFIMSSNMSDMTWRQQWRHLLIKQA